MTDGDGNGHASKGARLQKAVTELKAAEKLFPLAATMAEGLAGAKEAAVEEVTVRLNAINGKATGLEQIGKDVRDKAAKVEEHAGRVAAAEEKLGETGRLLDEKATSAAASAAAAATSAAEVNTAISSLKIKVGDKEFSGVRALEVLGHLVTGIPNSVKKEVERVVSAVVGEGDEKKTLKGAELISHVVLKADAAEAASGKAVGDAEHVLGLVELAGEQVNDARARADAAEESAEKAAEKASEAAASAGVVESLRAELKETKKQLDVAVGVLMTILNNNGLNTEVSEEEMREIEAEASNPDGEAASAGETA